MLDSLLLLNSLSDALKILKSARFDVCGSSSVVWLKLDRSCSYLDKQVAALLAE
jgi:hypothetical protein